MENLKEWLNKEADSIKKDAELQEKISEEIWETLDSEDGINQTILDVDNEKIKNILKYYFHTKSRTLEEKSRTLKEINAEIKVYNEEIKPRLEDKQANELFNRLLRNRKILPSSILKEFQIRDEILAESDPKIREFMELSLTKNFPSVILPGIESLRQRSKDACKELVAVTDPDEKKIIQRYLDQWYSPIWIKEEYEDYVYIKNYEYKNEDLKIFVLSLIENKKENPSLISYFFEIFKNWTTFWEDEEKYIRSLMNNPN